MKGLQAAYKRAVRRLRYAQKKDERLRRRRGYIGFRPSESPEDWTHEAQLALWHRNANQERAFIGVEFLAERPPRYP